MPELAQALGASQLVSPTRNGSKGRPLINKKNKTALVPAAQITQSILILRGHKVLLDETLATLYGVPTKALVQAVKRNLERFPEDFLFQLSHQDLAALRSQIVTSNEGRGGRRYTPYAFTEQGVAMLSSVLNSRRAIAVNIEIMRAFVRLREIIAGILGAIRQLMAPPAPPRRPIGFVTPEQKDDKTKSKAAKGKR